MKHTEHKVTIRFSAVDGEIYHLELAGPDVGERHGDFTPPYDPVTWGALLVALTASGGVLTTLVNTLQSWLTRHERRSVTLEIDGDRLEVTGISSQEQQRLIDTWLSRHGEIVIAND